MSTLLFVMWLIVNLLSFVRCVHQPIFRPMSTLLFVMWLIVNLLSFGRCGHQPVSRPMSTLLFCYVSDCQFVACLGACPSAHFFVRCPRCCFVMSVIINLLPFGRCVHQPFSRPMSTVLLCHIVGYQLVAFCPVCPSARFSSDVHEARLCDNRVVYGLLRIEHTTHAIQPSGEITSLKPSVQLS